ncbi:hypothetical protein FRC00_001210 [Tulasnella sp. 408]|nr:hypothetical protein FRC00_001210 [Tulasnella sp. 408]
MPPRFDAANQQPRRHVIPSDSSESSPKDADHTPQPRGSVDTRRPPQLAGLIARHASRVADAQSAHPVPGASSSSATVTSSEIGPDHPQSASEARPRLRRPDPTLRAMRAVSTIDERLPDSLSERDSIADSSPRWSVYDKEELARPMQGSMGGRARRDREPANPLDFQSRRGLINHQLVARDRLVRRVIGGVGCGLLQGQLGPHRQQIHQAVAQQVQAMPLSERSEDLDRGLKSIPLPNPENLLVLHQLCVGSRGDIPPPTHLELNLRQLPHPLHCRMKLVTATKGGRNYPWTFLRERRMDGLSSRHAMGQPPSVQSQSRYPQFAKDVSQMLIREWVEAGNGRIDQMDAQYEARKFGKNYIAYIAHRECIRPDGVKMYLTRPGSSPELVSNTDAVLNMSDGLQTICGRSRQRPLLLVVEPNSELPSRRYPSQESLRDLPLRDLDTELPHYPLYEDDLSLSALFVDYVPPPLRARDYISYIAELEGIHPSRITLYLSSQAEGSEIAEAQQIRKLGEIVTAETASSTSERHPILVNVKLEVDEYGNVHFGTKDKPLSRSSIEMIVDTLTLGWSK